MKRNRRYAWLTLMLCSMAFQVTTAEYNIKTELDWRLLGAGAYGRTYSPDEEGLGMYFLGSGGSHNISGGIFLDGYSGVYPGINVAYYGDPHHFEVVFSLLPGADPTLIRMSLDDMQITDVTARGDLVYERPCLEVYQHAPVISREVWPAQEAGQDYTWVRRSGPGVHLQAPLSRDQSAGRYDAWSANTVGVLAHDAYKEQEERLNGMQFNRVPGGEQPGGPLYDFFLSKFECTSDQVLRFLNDAQKHPDAPRGAFMYFDETGNAWFNPEMHRGRDELFDILRSKLVYDPDADPGERYRHQENEEGEHPFLDHPCGGISWYGAVKYCNWLTLNAGREPGERCYSEGTNGLSWAPITATNWYRGIFSDGERNRWLALKGFRLPMVNSDLPTVTTNRFNEFYKAGAWQGETNRAFGFGRDEWYPKDANCPSCEEGLNVGRTRSVGFYDGRNSIEGVRTRPEENGYGLRDITGNVDEWMNDPGRPGDPDSRAVCGISDRDGVRPISEGLPRAPYMTRENGGFRPTTTFMPAERIVIHVLYCFHTKCGKQEDEEEKEEKELAEKEEPEEPFTYLAFEDDDGWGHDGVIDYDDDEDEEEEEEDEEDRRRPSPASPSGT